MLMWRRNYLILRELVLRAVGILSLLVFCTVLTGCASIVDGGPGTVMIASTPSGARVRVNDKGGSTVATGNTPLTVKLDRGSGYFASAKYDVIVEKDGYAPYRERIEGELNAGWYLGGNLVFGGAIGWLIVDPLTGAMWNLSRDSIHAGLQRAASSELPPPVSNGIACRKCGHQNLKTAKFCVKCGEGLLAPGVCGKCGHANRTTAKFCVKCGGELR
jgi:ribosomal protein L40E